MNDGTAPPDPTRGLTAMEVLGGLSGGKLIEDLHLALILVAEEVITTRNPGAVTLTLKIAPAAGSDVALVISDKITRKPPENAARESLFFSVGDGQLRKGDPRQQRFELRALENGESEFRVTDQPETVIREVNG